MASRSGVTMAVGMCAPRCLVLLAARRFFRVFGLHKSFQAGQIGAPEDTVLLQPGINSFQRPRIQRVNDGDLPFSPGPSVPAAAGADVWRLQDVKQEMRGRFGLLAGCLVEADRAPRGAWDRRGPERRVLPNM